MSGRSLAAAMTLSQTRAWAAIATLLLPRGMPAIVCPPWQQRCRAMRRRTGRLVMRRLPMPKDEGRMLLSAQAAEDERGRRCGGDAVICHPPVTSHRSLEPGTKRKVFISAQCPTIVAVLADETVGSGLSIRWWGLEMQRALGIAPHRPALSSKDSPFAEVCILRHRNVRQLPRGTPSSSQNHATTRPASSDLR